MGELGRKENPVVDGPRGVTIGTKPQVQARPRDWGKSSKIQITTKCHHSVTTRLLLWCRVLIGNLLAGGDPRPRRSVQWAVSVEDAPRS